MKQRVVLRPIAQSEAEDSAKWYEARQTGLGVDFVAEVRKVIEMISESPDRFAVVHGDTREAPLARFPYCIYYRVRTSTVVVTAIVHTSRDPATWQRRG